MANRINLETQPRQNADTATGFSPPSNPSKNLAPRMDDLIVSLANAHENRRARQVTEWEEMRHRNFPMFV
jgi:hypothetical protein